MPGIHWLRALFSVAVVAWHLGGAGATGLNDRQAFATHSFCLADAVNLYGCLLAVPCFVLISAYLFCRKGPTWANLLRRLGRLGYLLAFWPIALTAWESSRSGLTDRIPDSLASLYVLALSGGQTLFYFFVSLIICLAVCWLLARLPSLVLSALLTLSLCLVGLAPLISSGSDRWMVAKYWSPMNFLPLSVAALLLARHDAWVSRHSLVIGLAALALGAGAGVWEWSSLRDIKHFSDMGLALPGYTRPSLTFLSVAVLVLAVRWMTASIAIVRFMSERSLALYCLHMFVMAQLMAAFIRIGLGGENWRLAHLAALVGLCYALCAVLERFLNRKLLY